MMLKNTIFDVLNGVKIMLHVCTSVPWFIIKDQYSVWLAYISVQTLYIQ